MMREFFGKKQNEFFIIFFHKFNLCIDWNWFIAKIILHYYHHVVASTDFPDPLSPPVSIIHHSQQAF